MHQRYFVLLSLLVSLPATAITFQTRLEAVQWTVAGDQFECRLSQPISDFGSGEFVRRAGESAIFRIKGHEHWLGNGSGTLLAAANLVRRMGAAVFEAAAIIDLPELGGSQKLQAAGIPTFCLTEFSLSER